ncbi:hypothetical protein CVT24_009121 [Panaeolus cyanescens]|uniref:Uncharacterized protein n=1 Tax=Panaeolus cyanescens TaxID=181874 RepID=A0A409VAM8_9AGAR|nr:hypothetical protein CVT24_009121 [Panaeolus cyanescens]
MAPYQTILNCMDTKEPQTTAAKPLQRHTLFSEVLSASIRLPRVSRARRYAFAEAFSAPIKYATFQALGTLFIHFISHFICHIEAPTIMLSTKLAAVGGSFLALLFITMIIAQNDWALKQEYKQDSTTYYTWTILQEMLCSAIAGLLGSLATSSINHHTSIIMAVAGAVGPLLFMAIGLLACGVVIGSMIATRMARDWYCGY